MADSFQVLTSILSPSETVRDWSTLIGGVNGPGSPNRTLPPDWSWHMMQSVATRENVIYDTFGVDQRECQECDKKCDEWEM